MKTAKSSKAIRAKKRKAKLKRSTGASERGPSAEPRLKEWSGDCLESGWARPDENQAGRALRWRLLRTRWTWR